MEIEETLASSIPAADEENPRLPAAHIEKSMLDPNHRTLGPKKVNQTPSI